MVSFEHWKNKHAGRRRRRWRWWTSCIMRSSPLFSHRQEYALGRESASPVSRGGVQFRKNNWSSVALQLRGRGLMWWLHLWRAPNWLWRISPFMTDLLIHQFDNDENDSETRTATKTIDRPLSLWISHNNRRDLWIMTLLPTLILDHQFKAEK